MLPSWFRRFLTKAHLPDGTEVRRTGRADLVELKLDQPGSWVGSFAHVPPPSPEMTIELFAAQWICEAIHGEDTPARAADFLEAGYDSPSLRRLAGETQVACSADVAELMRRVIRDFELPDPFSLRHARLLLTRQIARKVIAGLQDPWLAASQVEGIWGWRPDDCDVRDLLNCMDEVVWDPRDQRFRPTGLSDLLEQFARVGMLTDDQISN